MHSDIFFAPVEEVPSFRLNQAVNCTDVLVSCRYDGKFHKVDQKAASWRRMLPVNVTGLYIFTIQELRDIYNQRWMIEIFSLNNRKEVKDTASRPGSLYKGTPCKRRCNATNEYTVNIILQLTRHPLF